MAIQTGARFQTRTIAGEARIVEMDLERISKIMQEESMFQAMTFIKTKTHTPIDEKINWGEIDECRLWIRFAVRKLNQINLKLEC